MQREILTISAVAAFTASSFAGEGLPLFNESNLSTPVAAKATEGVSFLDDMSDWVLRPTLDARLRYEFREQQNLDPSNSLTTRFRPGLRSKDFGGFSLFAEGEFSNAIVDDYRSSPPAVAGATDPFVANNTVIADPETAELNQAYLSYAGNGFSAKVGRQRINLDAQQMVGGVAWRNNEQTFDGITVGYKNDLVDLFYGYITEVNRIFGSEPSGTFAALNALEGEAHMFNGKVKLGDHQVGAYAYLFDFSDQGDFASSNTYGAFSTWKTGPGSLYLEGAIQNESGNQPGYTDYYGHVKYSQKIAGIAGSIGLISHGSYFATPLQTAHKFNGFADAFLGQQLGLGQWDGLSDFYISGVKKGLPGGIKAVGALHYFMDDEFNDSYGWEADAVLVKPINENLTALAKFAYFFGNNDYDGGSSFGGYPNDIAQATVQLDYKF